MIPAAPALPAAAQQAPAGPEWRPAGFYRPVGDAVVCTLCPFACALGDGSLGRCRVRRRSGAGLETATFATSVAHLQQIERKPFYHFRPGLRVLTLAAPGCTFACSYCQNFRLSQYGRGDEAPWSARPVSPAALVSAAAEAQAAIAFSYSEPVLAAELTLGLSPLARAAGVDLLWKTNGFITPAAARLLAPALAAVNVDLKAPDDRAHRALTGAPLAPVLDALAAWREAGVWIELSTPLIPGFNSDEASIMALAERVCALGAETPWHLLRFHPDHRLTAAPPTSPAVLLHARQFAERAGLRHVYVERALGAAGRDTLCPRCRAVVVARQAPWAPGESRLADGRCPDCSAVVAGRW